jgi:dTDP-4-amino-4,6-dideoxygalactose transaminase
MAIRDENAAYLRARLDSIEGIEDQALTPGAERSAYHLFIFRYDRNGFGGLPRDKFVEALNAEGISVSKGYNPLYREGMFQQGWDPNKCPFSCKDWEGTVDYSQTYCPVAEHVCTDGSFWAGQNMLLGSRQDMDDIAEAILKIQGNLGEIKD